MGQCLCKAFGIAVLCGTGSTKPVSYDHIVEAGPLRLAKMEISGAGCKGYMSALLALVVPRKTTLRRLT